ncbi:MAG TPA: response regulator [Bdellovibrionales bacterium]|nr:response regulator [Bdellovibrionales bacterium]
MKVLVVDDEPLVRRSLEKALVHRGHQVVQAADGRAGMDVWISEKPDLIFLDILMPGLSGLQVLKELGPRKTGKVVLMSAYSGVHGQETVQQMGADLFVAKPFDDILEVVKKAEGLIA